MPPTPVTAATTFISRSLSPLQRKYTFGYATLMYQSRITIEAEGSVKAQLRGVDEVIEACYKAYCASALRGTAVAFWIESQTLRWDSVNAWQGNMVERPGQIVWQAFEDLPSWMEVAERPYSTVLAEMPSLISRLEVIQVEDAGLKLCTTDDDVVARIESVSKILRDSLRNDGFLIHGGGLKVQVHHRNAREVVNGLAALERNMLAHTDYTEQALLSRRSRSGGLGGVDTADATHERTQVASRLALCWEPVIRLWASGLGIRPDAYKIGWSISQDSLAEQARVELDVAKAAALNVVAGVTKPSAYTDRFTGGDTPGVFPEVDEDDPYPEALPPAATSTTPTMPQTPEVPALPGVPRVPIPPAGPKAPVL